jgi:hypothetical protein
MHRLSALMVAITLLSSHSAFAEGTGTGSTAQSSSSSAFQEDLAKAQRAKRVEGFATAIKKFQMKDKQFQEALATYNKARLTRRAECRAEIRKANKQTKVAVELRCLRSDMTQERDLLKKYVAYFQEVPGLSKSVRTVTLDRTEALLDAIETVIDGVDSGVYETEADLQETKKNLFQKYRSKAWSSWVAARVDSELTWLALMITDIDELQKMNESEGLTAARTCFVAQETSLQDLAEERAAKGVTLGTVQVELKKCAELLDEAKKAAESSTGTGASVNR